jgi:hypothetical protein
MLLRLVTLPVRAHLWRPTHLRLIAADLLHGPAQPVADHDAHLRSAIEWLCLAQDVRRGQVDQGGVSAGWSFEDGWLPSYPETSGYIVETLVQAAIALERPELRLRAQAILDWELSIQNVDGSFPGHFGEPGSAPVVFNTGQIMHGMVTGFEVFGRDDCLEAAVKAGGWLARCQDDDGCWRRNVHNRCPHTYNTRAAWALLRAGEAAGDAMLRTAARRNMEWAVAQQTPSGWFASNAFVPNRAPFTHTIAYAIRGLLEGGAMLAEERFVSAALTAARALAAAQRPDGSLAGTFADGWRPAAGYCCLTGVAQMCINWLRLRRIVAEEELAAAAQRGIRYLKTTQRLVGRPEVAGAIAGSMPIWGGYSRFEYPNWAAKFFADALLMDRGFDGAVPAAGSTRPEAVEEVVCGRRPILDQR